MTIPTRREFLKGGAAGLAALTGGGSTLLTAGCAVPLRGGVSDDLRIWDLHCHLRRTPEISAEDAIAELVKYADRMGIERLILLSLASSHATPEEVRQANDRTLRA